MLYDQRGGGVWSKRGTAKPKRLTIALPSLLTGSEGGMLGMVADPKAADNKIFYTCQARQVRRRPLDVRVLRWRLTDDTHAEAVGSPAVTGLPVTSGRHSGCRLRFGPDGKLYIGTGDAATTGNSQNRQSLGGKVLRVNADGTIPTDNPFYGEGRNARYVWSYGHRNVQGLAFRPGTDRAVERRAGHLPRRRGQPHRQGRQLRLAGAAGLQRVAADDGSDQVPRCRVRPVASGSRRSPPAG